MKFENNPFNTVGGVDHTNSTPKYVTDRRTDGRTDRQEQILMPSDCRQGGIKGRVNSNICKLDM